VAKKHKARPYENVGAIRVQIASLYETIILTARKRPKPLKPFTLRHKLEGQIFEEGATIRFGFFGNAAVTRLGRNGYYSVYVEPSDLAKEFLRSGVGIPEYDFIPRG
jgi:hypothetical protein